jgi:hypothetical protein
MSKLALQVGALCLAAFAAGAVRAQNPPQPAGPPGAGQDSVMMPRRWQRTGGQMNQQRRDELMTQIQERFAQRVQAQLALTDQQMDRLRAEMRSDRDQHRQLQDHEQDMRRAIGEQLRPGVAANPDSLSRLLDAVAANHVARAQLEQQELRSLSFLSPVQRARLLMMRQMLMQRVETIRQGRFRGPQGGNGFGGRQAPAPQEPGPR